MIVTVVAVLVQLSTGFTVEEIVTDSAETPSLSFTTCAIHGQIGISDWMRNSPKYRTGWRLDRYKCVPGHYEPRGRA